MCASLELRGGGGAWCTRIWFGLGYAAKPIPTFKWVISKNQNYHYFAQKFEQFAILRSEYSNVEYLGNLLKKATL